MVEGPDFAVVECVSGPGGWTVGVRHSSAFTGAVLADDMAAAERLLDAIEDRALALKREQAG